MWPDHVADHWKGRFRLDLPVLPLVLASGLMGNQLLVQSAWWVTNALEGLLLFRALRGGFFWRYAVFYLYLSYVLSESLMRFYFYEFRPNLYSSVYWSSQFVSVTIGYAVIWEIFRQTLKDYPGAARVARTSLLTIFVLVLCKVFMNGLSGAVFSPTSTYVDLERYLRVVQVALLVTIVGFVAYYSISIGRNLKGMILGYGFFIGMTVIHLALRSYLGVAFQPVWQHLGWVSYSVALAIWCSTLWSYQPNPQPSSDVAIDRDYERVALRTAKLLAEARASLVKAIRP